MVINPLIGVAYALGARLFNKEVVPTGQIKDGLIHAQQRVERIIYYTENIDMASPATWVAAGNRVLSDYLAGGGKASIASYCVSMNMFSTPGALLFVQYILANQEPKIVAQDGLAKADLVEIVLFNGEKIWAHRDSGVISDVMITGNHIISPEHYEGLAHEFWKTSKTVLLDEIDERPRVELSKLNISDAIYHGELVNLLPKWQKAWDKGIRRNILLQGRPGSGKTTFCYHAARELDARTLVVTAPALSAINMSQWFRILGILKPDMVIVNDIDRMGSTMLGSLLQRFEEGACEVPFVLFTTNDIHKLPQAMRRPGRIDQIIEVCQPSEEIANQTLDKLAARENTFVQPGDHARLREMMEKLSPAHVVEVFRRAYLYGWDDLMLDGDLTFDFSSYNTMGDNERETVSGRVDDDEEDEHDDDEEIDYYDEDDDWDDDWDEDEYPYDEEDY